ncbi:MAG: gephyrin-like molybdotransferase Glp [Pseudomonadota bacterium]
MISVDDALDKILGGVNALPSETVGLSACVGRVAASDVVARITQPPFAASAMDGYAVRFADMAIGAALAVIGEAPAGAPFDGSVGAGEAVRIFTGGVIPPGADHILIQEDAAADGASITVTAEQSAPRHVRSAGVDFLEGDRLASAGARLHAIHGSIFAAANIGAVDVVRRPVVALFANGNELKDPGEKLSAGEIINSNHYALSAMIEAWGGVPEYFGCAPDDPDAVVAMFNNARRADIIVPIGGASVGDHDYVKSAFDAAGGALVFSKIAVRPGKPTWFGGLDGAFVLGLPGNPASAIVTAALFLQPLVRRLGGRDGDRVFLAATLAARINANGPREHYMRATMTEAGAVEPAPNQDSSLLSPFASADVLIRRQPQAPAAEIGDKVEIVALR